MTKQLSLYTHLHVYTSINSVDLICLIYSAYSSIFSEMFFSEDSFLYNQDDFFDFFWCFFFFYMVIGAQLIYNVVLVFCFTVKWLS